MSGHNPFEIGIAITMQNMVSSVLGIIAGDMLKLEKIQKNVERGFHSWHGAVAAAAAGAVGITALGASVKLVEHGNELVRLQRNMEQTGASNLQIQNAYNKAWELTAKYQNMSAVEILKLQSNARQIFGDQDVATAHIDPVVQAASFLKAYEGHEKGGKDSESIMRELEAAIKSGELAGKIGHEEMAEHIKQLTAMKVVYGEGLKIQTYLAAQRAAGVALRNTSDDFRYGTFPALVQENGSGAGVMMMTAFNKIVAGVGNRTLSLEKMLEMGLVKQSQVEYNKQGRPSALKHGLENSMDAALQFGDWVHTILKPKLERQLNKEGVHGEVERNIRESEIISKLFPDRKAAQFLTELIQQYNKFQKDAKNSADARKAMDMNKYNAGSWDYQVGAFTEQWKNFLDAVGAPIVKQATEMLAKVNKVMADMAQWAAANPAKAEMLAKTLVAVGVGLTALGAVAVGGALLAMIGSGGWLVAGFATIGALTATGTFNKDTFKKITSSIEDGLRSIYEMGQSGELKARFVQGLKAFGKWLIGDFTNNLYEVATTGTKIIAMMMAAGWELVKAVGSALWEVGKQAAPIFLQACWEIVKAIGSSLKDAMSQILPSFHWIDDFKKGWSQRWDIKTPIQKNDQQGFNIPPNPNGGGENRTANIIMQVDGQTIGKVAANYIGRSGTYPLSPSVSDSHGQFALPAFN